MLFDRSPCYDTMPEIIQQHVRSRLAFAPWTAEGGRRYVFVGLIWV